MTWSWLLYKMESPTFFLEGIVRDKDEAANFEGPLSLILMLLSKNKIEIRDISISEILDQYLAQLEQMERMDLEIASEFVSMAAYLLYIKTKTLLVPDAREISELEQLMENLEKLRARGVKDGIKTVLPAFSAASEQGFLRYTRRQEPQKREARAYDYRHDAAELMDALLSVFSRGSKVPPPPDIRAIAPKRIVYAVRDKSREIIERLRGGGSVALRALYDEGRSRSEVVATFISVLELVSMGSLEISEKGKEYVLTFTGGDTDAILEAIEE